MGPNAQALEQLVDRMGLRNTVDLLAIICELKCEQALEHGEAGKAKGWINDAHRLDAVTRTIQS